MTPITITKQLKCKCIAHDWESVERHDLMERLAIMQELKVFSLADIGEILKEIGPRKGVILIEAYMKFRREM